MKTSVVRATLSCALLATTALSSNALAQTGAPYRNLDANGVDLSRGDYLMQLVEGSIGSGRGQLSLVREQGYYSGYNGHHWDSIMLYETASSRSVSFGQQRYEYFTGTSSAQGNGATLILSGSDYIHQAADGTVTTFVKQDPNCSPGPSGFCRWIPTSIASPDGRTVTLNWDQWLVCDDVPIEEGGPTCTVDSVRLGSVANDQGYSIAFTHADPYNSTGSGSGTSTVGPSWFQRTRADFYNSAAGTSSQGNVTYSYPSTSVTDVTNMGGLTWRITGGSLVTGIRRPGASSDTTTISRSGYVTSVTRDGVTTSYSYSVSGSTGTMVVTDALSNATTIVSNLTFGRPTSVTDPLSRVTSYTYDSYGRLTRVTQPEGNYVEYTYDARGNVTETRAVAQPGSGLPDIVTSASFDTSCSNPVTCNQPNGTTDAQGNTTSYTYDSTHGGVLTVTGPTVGSEAPETRYSYTLDSGTGEYRLTAVSACVTGSASTCVGTANEARTVIGYDSNGNVNSVQRRDGTGALSSTTTATWTALGDVETVDGPLAGAADTTRFRYNAARQQVGVIGPDPDGSGSLQHRAARTVYDGTTGLPTAVQRGSVAGQSDTDWAGFSPVEEVQTSYDANARPVVQRLVSGSTTYALTQTSYDALGRPECVAQRMNPSEFAPSSLPSDACTLDTQGSHGPDRIVRTTRDDAGQVTLVQTGYGVTGVQADEVATTYTNNGQVTTLTDGEGNVTTCAYDGHDRLSRTCFPGTTSCAGTPGGSADYEQLTYETHVSGTLTSGQVASRRQRDNSSIGYTYDALGRLSTVDVPSNSYWEGDLTFSYDLLGRRTLTVDQWNYSTRLTWDALGRLVSDRQFVQIDMSYDAAGRLTRLTWPDSFYVDYDHLVTGEVSAVRENGATSGIGVLATYAYDDLGRRVTLTRGNGTVTTYGYGATPNMYLFAHNFAGTADDVIWTFTHNPAAQIASSTRSNDGYAWAGHINVNRGYTANGLNQYTASGSITPTYDARGNLTSAGTSTYAYTPLNRLATAPGGINLTYYVDGRLLDASTNGQGPLFAYVGGTMVGEYNGYLNLQRRYVHGPGTDEPLVWYEGSGTSDRRWFHADERGSIVATSDSSGTATSINSYDEHGIPATGGTAGTLAGRFGYTGQAWQPNIGLYYYRNRIYSPTLGRFMQTDPIGYGDGMNLYAYVRNDPVNFTDPLGLCRSDQVRMIMPGGGPATGGTSEDDPITVTGGRIICLNMPTPGPNGGPQAGPGPAGPNGPPGQPPPPADRACEILRNESENGSNILPGYVTGNRNWNNAPLLAGYRDYYQSNADQFEALTGWTAQTAISIGTTLFALTPIGRAGSIGIRVGEAAGRYGVAQQGAIGLNQHIRRQLELNRSRVNALDRRIRYLNSGCR